MIHASRLCLLLALCGAAATCGDPFEPILTPVPEPREADLVDFEEGDLVDPAAYDMYTGNAVRTDLSNGWDFVFVVDGEAGPTFVPRSAFLGGESTAGLQQDDRAFDTIEEAPEADYVTDAPVPVAAGDVLTLISRRSESVSVRCRLFGKLEVLTIEGTPATATVRVVVNPNCERRHLVEPEEED